MRILLLCCVVLLAACARQPLPVPPWLSPERRDHPDLGLIYDLRSGERLSPAQLLDRLQRAPRVLVGEQHDNPDHHTLQLWLLRELAVRRAQGSLLLEMLTPSQQDSVNRARPAAQAGRPLTDPYASLAWQPGWSWSLYGPLVMHALAQPYPLLAANLDRNEMMQVYRQPPSLAGRRSTADGVRQALLDDIRESHCGLLPESQLPAMLAIQQQRDRHMAQALAAAPAPALLIAGAFHVRKDLGVPLHLADLGLGADQPVLILAEAGRRVDAEMADFVWFTAAQPEQDHCAKLRR